MQKYNPKKIQTKINKYNLMEYKKTAKVVLMIKKTLAISLIKMA